MSDNKYVELLRTEAELKAVRRRIVELDAERVRDRAFFARCEAARRWSREMRARKTQTP